MAQLTLTNITKRFGKNLVLDRVNVDIISGELMVILGPSGCGKSTLLNIVAGIEDLDSGTVQLDGRNIEHLSPGKRDIAMVFQSHALYPHMNVQQNMSFGLRMHGVPKKEIHRRVAEVASMLNISHLLQRKPGQMSGGERQRVAMGRAIARHPQIYLLDEPLSSLDAQLRTQIRTEIKRLHARLGITMIYVTHDQTEAMTLADRISIMDAGRIVQVGTPHEVYHKPQTAFVGTFLGNPSMNLIPARFDAGSGALRLMNTTPPFKVAGRSLPEECLVGFRPEHVRLGKENSLALEGIIDIVEPTGSDLYALIDCQGFSIKARFRNNEIAPGQDVRLSIATEHIHLFDAASGQRL